MSRLRPGSLFVALGLLLAPFAPPGAVADDPPERPFQVRVDEAIDEGVAWLRSVQREDGSFPLGAAPDSGPGAGPGAGDPSQQWAGGPWDKGYDALCVYTLAVCDVAADDPALESGFDRLRDHWRNRVDPADFSRADGISTYFVSLCLMALDAHYNRGAAPMGQGPPDRRRSGRRLLGKRDYAWARELAAWLEEAQQTDDETGGGFGYGSPAATEPWHDHSNSQFAVLGLKAAARMGVKVPDAVFLRSLEHFLDVQEEEGPEVERVDAADAADPRSGLAEGESRTTDEGPRKDHARGWGYTCRGGGIPTLPAPDGFPPGGPPPGGFPPGGFPPGGMPPGGLPPGAVPGPLPLADDLMGGATAAMTAGGVSTLFICRSELDGARGFTRKLRARTETAIRDGLAWLANDLARARASTRGLPPGLDPESLPEGFGPGSLPFSGGTLDNFYFLYGLERACILGGVSRIGGADWYVLGALRILEQRREDGSFQSRDQSNGNGRPSIDSCFALLFLKRAVFRVPGRAVTPSTGE